LPLLKFQPSYFKPPPNPSNRLLSYVTLQTVHKTQTPYVGIWKHFEKPAQYVTSRVYKTIK